MVSLSATVSNAEEFGDWLDEVRGDTEVVVEEHRPVPLWQHMMVGQRHATTCSSTSRATRRDPAWTGRSTPSCWTRCARARTTGAAPEDAGGRGRRGAPRPRRAPRAGAGSASPSRADVIERLDRDGLLPAITFIFSRAGCNAAVRPVLAAACG